MLETKSWSILRNVIEPSASVTPFDATHLFVGGEKQINLAFDWNSEWIF